MFNFIRKCDFFQRGETFRFPPVVNEHSICPPFSPIPTPLFLAFPCGSAGNKSTCNAEDLGLIPGRKSGKIPWRREQLSTPVFWPGEFHGLYSLWGCKETATTEQLSLSSSLIFTFNTGKVSLRHYLRKKGGYKPLCAVLFHFCLL